MRSARLDCLCCLIGTVALYFGVGDLHEHGAPSPVTAALLFFAPLIVGMVLGLRGHVLPTVMHVYGGATNAIATMGPLLVMRSEAEVLGLSWWSVAQVLLLLGLIAVPAALCSFAGAELGGLVHRWLPHRSASTYLLRWHQ
jgi:hypothetical protein